MAGRNSSAAAGSTVTTPVRVSFGAGTPAGTTTLSPCVFVNEGTTPFEGTTLCSQVTKVTVVAAPSTPTATPTATTTPTASPTAGGPTATGPAATPSATASDLSGGGTDGGSGGSGGADGGSGGATGSGHLAETGSDAGLGYLALGGTALVGAGGALLYARRRRNA
ncbi:LPXTG cell wall anchor domain-containing protein [Streptacidiphilus sp. 4-A2]|nr:LPXTG cell wall anchor domain-containing protein [Streptacidiphilus sp. 4-A2]